MDNKRASSSIPKLWVGFRSYGRGAFQRQRRYGVSGVGASGKANVGISNDKAGEKPARRKDKVS
jgi:hypothetical protein